MFSLEQFDIDEWIITENKRPVFMMKGAESANRVVALLNSNVPLVEKLKECMIIIEMEAKYTTEHSDALKQKHSEIKSLLESLPKSHRV